MIFRKLLTTTAVVAMTATGAFVVSPLPNASAATMESGYMQQIGTAEYFASDLIGATVYNSTNPDAESIGDVNDMVVSENGTIEAVVIGVGGFLGIGEKDVAVSYGDLAWTTDERGMTSPVLNTTMEELEAAPAFERQRVAAMNQESPMAEQPATGDQMAMTDEPAMETQQPDNAGAAPADDPLAAYDPSLVSADTLIDTVVYSSDGENVGEVSDVLLSDGGEIDAVVIDVGGFLGMGEKPVAIKYADLRIAVDEDRNLILQTAFTRDQLDAAPEYDETAYRDHRDQVVVDANS